MRKTIYKHLFLLLAIILAGTGQAYADDYILGDANNSNEVEIGDIVAVTNYIHNNTPANFNALLANVNGDDEINIADVVGITNIIHYKTINANSTIEDWTEGNTGEELETQPLGEDEDEDNNYGD